jgi:hypothetical protein
MSQERRTQPRFPAEAGAWLDLGGAEHLPVRICDVSPEGVGVADLPADRKLHPGEVVRVLLKTETSSVTCVPGRIVWCEGSRVGVQFTALPLSDSEVRRIRS